MRGYLGMCIIFVIFITETKLKNDMKDITEISELNKWLSDLPQITKYKDKGIVRQ